MRVANLAGRLTLLVGGRAIDVETASDGQFGAEPAEVYLRWSEFVSWARDRAPVDGAPFRPADLGAPSPRPTQVFALALNYRDHALATGVEPPRQPSVFTKYATAVTGPYGPVELPDGDVDWEVELVAVIGKRAEHVPATRAWDHVAGLTVGQDLSERRLQFAGETPQFSLAKSHPGFAPMGPCLVTTDELDDPDDVAFGCSLNGEPVQASRSRHLVFDVPAIIAYLSGVLPLLPGDVIFTGTPAGVGADRRPPRFLAPGDLLVSHAKGIGEMRHTFTAPPIA